VFGYKDREDYYRQASCVHKIKDIQTPTFFMNALDDPIVLEGCLAYEEIKNNRKTILGTNSHGGHLGYHESFFTLE